MPTVDFSQPKGGCDVILNNDSAKIDPASDSFLFKVDVAIPLTGHEDAKVAGRMLPGLGEMYLQADESDNWKASTSVKPAKSLRVVLTAKEAGVGISQGAVAPGAVIIQGQAELVELKASLSKRARVVLARFLFRGQGANVAEGLIQNRSKSVGMSFEQVQTVLAFTTTAKPPTLRPGMIVAASAPNGEQVVGRLVEMDGDELSLQEAGTEITVSASDVISAFAFATDGDTQAALSDYQERCERRELPVSWRALVEVLAARSGLEGGATPTSGASVSADDIEAAVTRAESLAGREPVAEESVEQAPEEETGQVAEVVELGADKPKRQPRARARA